MKAKHVLMAGLFLAAGLAVAAPADGLAGQEKRTKDAPKATDGGAKADNKEKEISVTYVEDLAAAYRMADAGRDGKSPEMLVGAGSLLHKLALMYPTVGKIEEQPKSEKGEPVKDKAMDSPSLDTEAKELFKEARALAAGDKALLEGVNALIKAAEARKYGASRGAVGGPRNITRNIAPGDTHTYNIPFFTGIPAAIAVRGNGISLHCRMAYNDFVHFEQTVKTGQYSWVPKPDGPDRKVYLITIRNVGMAGGQYTLTTN